MTVHTDPQHAPDFLRRGRHALYCMACCLLVAATVCAASAPAAAGNDDFAEQLSRARRLSRTREFTEARSTYERAIELAAGPAERAEALFGLGRLLRQMDQRNDAIDTFTDLLDIDTDTAWHVQAAEQLARIYDEAADYDRAIDAWKRLGELHGATPQQVQNAMWQQVRLHQKLGNDDAAVSVAARLVEQFPEGDWTGVALHLLVRDCISKGEYDRAVQLARTQSRRDGGHLSIMINVALQLERAGQDGRALDIAEEYSRLRPHDDLAWQLLYTIHDERGTLDEYEKQLRAAAESDDMRQATSALLRLSDLYERSQRLDRALDSLDRLLQRSGGDPQIAAAAGQMAVRSGQPEKAIAYYKKALDDQPENDRLRAELGDVYAKLGDEDRALETWKRAYSYNPQDVASVNRLGAHLHGLGRYQKAIDIYLEGRHATSMPAAYAEMLGREYEALLRIDSAVDEYLLAMQTGGSRALSAQRRLQLLASDATVGPEVINALQERQDEGALPPAAAVALGLAYLQTGGYEKAREVLHTLGKTPDGGQALVHAAGTVDDAGDTEAALELYRFAAQAQLQPGLAAGAATRRAALLLNNRRWQQARDALKQAADRELPQGLHYVLQLALADILVLWAGQPDAAAPIYSEVLATSPVQEQVRHAAWGLADCAFIAGEYPHAAKAYRQLLETEAFDGDAAAGQQAGGRSSGGYVPLIGAVQLPRPMGPPYAAYQLAEIQFRRRKFKDALDAYENVADLYPDSEYANDALARVLLIRSEFKGQSPAEPKYIEALGHVDRGQLENAGRILNMISSLGPREQLADDAAMLYADASARFGSREEALKQYMQLADDFPESPLAPEALLKAGRLAARSNESRDLAMKLLRRLQTDHRHTPQAAEAELVMDSLLAG